MLSRIDWRVLNSKAKILNTELVDDDQKTTEALTQSFLKHKGNKKLFINPGRFRRIEK